MEKVTIKWTKALQSILDSSKFERTLSTGCDYYHYIDGEPDSEVGIYDFEVGDDYIRAMPQAIDWLLSQV